MITCNSHIYKDVIDEYNVGKYVNLEDANLLAKAINEMLINDSQLMQMSKNCITASEEKFYWKSQEKLLFEFYENLIS